jgi:hypothetical protein
MHHWIPFFKWLNDRRFSDAEVGMQQLGLGAQFIRAPLPDRAPFSVCHGRQEMRKMQ